MTTKYGNTFVDEKYSAILEPNLYAEQTLQPGITFNNQYQGDANSGLVKIFKTTKDAAGAPTTPAGDFSHENTANTLIDLRLNNAFRKSKKVYKVTADSIAYDLAEETLSTAVKDNAEDRQRAAYACLVNEGTIENSTTETTAANIKAHVAASRKALRKAHAKPDVVFASVDAYSAMLETAGDKYIPTKNDGMVTNGQVGTWLGMTWFECDGLEGTGKYYNHEGNLISVDLDDVEYVMFDHRAFNVVDNLEVMRIENAVDFVGVYAQNEINSGFRVPTAAKVSVKTKGALSI